MARTIRYRMKERMAEEKFPGDLSEQYGNTYSEGIPIAGAKEDFWQTPETKLLGKIHEKIDSATEELVEVLANFDWMPIESVDPEFSEVLKITKQRIENAQLILLSVNGALKK